MVFWVQTRNANYRELFLEGRSLFVENALNVASDVVVRTAVVGELEVRAAEQQRDRNTQLLRQQQRQPAMRDMIMQWSLGQLADPVRWAFPF